MKPKPDKKFKKNSYEEMKKLAEDGDEMQLKGTTKTKKDKNKNDNKIQFNLFDEIGFEYNKYLVLFIYYETFAPEDILIDNLSFKLNKGRPYIQDRRSVSFFPSASNMYKPSSGARVLTFSLNGEQNTWLDRKV